MIQVGGRLDFSAEGRTKRWPQRWAAAARRRAAGRELARRPDGDGAEPEIAFGQATKI